MRREHGGAQAPEPEQLLQVQTFTEADALLVELTGELDLDTAPLLDRAIAEAHGKGQVAIDCGGLTFVDSMGLAALSRLALAAASGSVLLRNTSRMIRALVAVTGLQSQLVVEVVGAGEGDRHTVDRSAPIPSTETTGGDAWLPRWAPGLRIAR